MAGVKLSTIEKTLKTKKIVRIMPNLMASNAKSHTHIYMKNKNLFDSKLKKILSSFGTTINVRNEDQINFATSVFGSGPAFIAYLVNIFVKASKKLSEPYNMNEKDIIENVKTVCFEYVKCNVTWKVGFENVTWNVRWKNVWIVSYEIEN